MSHTTIMPTRGPATPRVHFPFISKDAFISDTDKVALNNLIKLPLLPLVVRKFNEIAGDRVFYAQNSATSVRCGPNQFKTIYNLMREACATMHIPEPEIYMKYDHTYNAYTAGMDRTFIVIHSALAEDFTDEELLYIIGHETGHIKCGHVLYQMMGRMLIPMMEALGHATMGAGQLVAMPLVTAFYEWMRQAEFSCDRAGLLVCQSPQVAFTATMKMGGGMTRFIDEMNTDAFLEQARQHAEGEGAEKVTKALLFLMYNWQLDHPQVVYRAKALDEWVNGGKYDTIMSGNYLQDVTGGSQLGHQVKCPKCRKTVSSTVQFCTDCGADLRGINAPVVSTQAIACPGCQQSVPAGIKFCPNCGHFTQAPAS